MESTSGTIAYITSGAGGMFCGSCLHDNTLARALIRRGLDVQLIPTYTPIRTDEEDVSSTHVFYGGVNVFLSQTVPFYRHLPAMLTGWLDHPRLINWATRRAAATSAASLGALTVSMLRGVEGNQRRELDKMLEKLEELSHSAAAAQLVRPVETALDDIPALAMTEDEARRLQSGQGVSALKVARRIPLRNFGLGTVFCAFAEGKPVALARFEGGELRPIRVLNL